jgi:hypothetical protein
MADVIEQSALVWKTVAAGLAVRLDNDTIKVKI